MPLREYPYRVAQASKKRIDRRLAHRLACRGESPHLSDLSKTKLFVENNTLSRDSDLIVNDAEEIIRHRFRIFGIEWNYGDPINWSLDPKTRKSWPLKFWGDINYRDGKTIGGIKFAWELNRLQHWPRLGIAYRLTGKREYVDEIFSQLAQWLESNPYPKGINWISGIELGLRIVSLYYSLKLLGVAQLSTEQKDDISRFVALHARHLYRYPSKYSSCGNHALAEALGLFIAGTVFLSFKDAIKWKSYGKSVLEREVTRQILPDGTSFEYTIPYLQFVADHFLVYYLICREYGEKIPGSIEERLKAVCNFIAHVIDKKGNIPMIGDDDDGYLLKLSPGSPNNFLSILNTCSLLFNKPEWIHPAAVLDAKTLVLLGESGIAQWETFQSKKAWKPSSAYFENAGLAVMAHHNKGKQILFVGNNGPTGLEPLGGHGHADALSFWLSVDGQPVFVDPGTYLYHSGGKWRRYFRSTAAHNTIEIDGQDQAEQVADFMFGTFCKCHDVIWADEADKILWGAAHNGYLRLPDPVVHRRDVTFHKKDCLFRIRDHISAKKRHRVKLFFHLHPDVNVERQDENVCRLFSDSVNIRLTVDRTMTLAIFKGSEGPLSGWYSPRFNRLHETTTLVFSKEIAGDSLIESEVAVL